MSEMIYRRLAEHLNRLPGGFPPSATGAEVALLKRLFTPEEADLAPHLKLNPEKAPVIADRAGLHPVDAESRLLEMARKGLILETQLEDGSVLYQAVPFVVGIYEFQVNHLSDGLLRDLNTYWSTAAPDPRDPGIPQMRTIPLSETIRHHPEVLPYEKAEELVMAHDRVAVAPCICRRQARMRGKGCDAPEESCLIFGDWAGYYIRSGRGRAVEQVEVSDILARADAANLVLQPSNSREIAFLCCCCGCCCGVLKGLRRSARPAEAAVNAFTVRMEPENCRVCGTCIERCQMQALSPGADHPVLNADRCIGCGLCVSTCPSRGLRLVRRSEMAPTGIPDDMNDTWRVISRARAPAP